MAERAKKVSTGLFAGGSAMKDVKPTITSNGEFAGMDISLGGVRFIDDWGDKEDKERYMSISVKYTGTFEGTERMTPEFNRSVKISKGYKERILEVIEQSFEQCAGDIQERISVTNVGSRIKMRITPNVDGISLFLLLNTDVEGMKSTLIYLVDSYIVSDSMFEII